jgi:ribosomal protein S18 acetylase RimI-like enzyme
MLGCTKQWKGYVPAALNEVLPDAPPAMLEVHLMSPSSSATPCGTPSPFVHVITSPTLALMVDGTNAWPSIPAVTVPVPDAGAQTAALPPPVDGTVVAPPPPVGGTDVVPPPPPPQAATRSAVLTTVRPRASGRISILQGADGVMPRVHRVALGRRVPLLSAWRHDSATGWRSFYGSAVGADRISDPDLARRMVLHEARAQHTPARELRDLGDGWLLHDPNDAEPFWNRLVAPAWPSESAAFQRRLDEIVTLFATVGRLPHIRPLPAGCEPPDMSRRLEAAGFEVMGADRRMLLLHPEHTAEVIAGAEASVDAALPGAELHVSRQGRERASERSPRVGRAPSWPERRRWAVGVSLVLVESFGVEHARRIALEHDVLACIARPGCSMLLVSVDGEPAAVARTAGTDDGSYLSSIGTRPRFRGRGLGALVTMLAVRDALAAGDPFVHLAVDDDNAAARRLYERLGFVVVGDPAPDLLLH